MTDNEYNVGKCCKDDCYKFDYQDEGEPCWGTVWVLCEEYTDDDCWWIHACEGHFETYDGGEYIKKPND